MHGESRAGAGAHRVDGAGDRHGRFLLSVAEDGVQVCSELISQLIMLPFLAIALPDLD